MRVFVEWQSMAQYQNSPRYELEFDSVEEAQKFCDDQNNGDGYAEIITNPARAQRLMETEQGAFDAPRLWGHAENVFRGIDDD